MAARKDEGRKAQDSGRRAVIWRLPSAQETSDSRDAGEPERPRGRRVPLPVLWGLVAALVCVGLYAAWSEVGRDMLGTSGEPAAASAPAPAASQAPATAAGAGGDEAGGATATPPPSDGAGVPLVVADEGGDETPAEAPSRDAAPVVDAEAAIMAGAEAAAGTSAAAEPPEDSEATVVSAEGAPAAEGSESARPSLPADPEPAAPSPAAALPEAAAAAPQAPDALEARLGVLEAQASGALASGAVVTALAERVRVLEEDPARATLDRALAAWEKQRGVLEAALAETGARIARLEEEGARQAAADGRLMVLVLATGDLAAALGSSRAFAPAFDALNGIAGEDAEIERALARLAPFAGIGVETLDGLRARFPEVANAIVRAGAASDDDGWIDETVTRLSQLVTIRRTGGALDPESVDGRLVLAEEALATGDLAQAIALVEALVPGTPEAAIAREWLRDARARREADDAHAALAAVVRDRVGGRWAAGGTSP